VDDLQACETPRFPARAVSGPLAIPGFEPIEYTLLEGRHERGVRDALDRVKRAFSSARLSDAFTGCPHCFMQSDIEYVRFTPADSLTQDDLAVIGLSLVSTLGSAEDVPYFIPRLLEALAKGLPVDVEPLVDRFTQVPAALWTAERLEALRAAFEVMFEAGHAKYAEGGAYDSFADAKSREYVFAKLAELPNPLRRRMDD
jgi:hypothetical protein